MTRFDKTKKQINDAIHAVKNEADMPNNPDVVVDEAGEVYPLGRDNIAGESIGNLFDYLGD